MTDSSLTDNSVDLILKAINDMQDKINAETDKKLEKFVQKPEFQDLENLVASMQRRVAHNEKILQQQGERDEEHTALIEANRKRILRLQADIDALRHGNRTGSAMSNAATEEKVEPIVLSSRGGDGGGDGAGIDQEAIDKLQRMIQRVEGSLIRRIASVEGIITRVDGIEDDMGIMKADIAKALKPRDPNVTREDVERWNANCKKTDELEEMLKNLKLFVEDYPKIKADVLNILKIQNTFVTKDSLTPLIERIRVQEEKLKDVNYQIETVRDVQLKTDKVIEANH